MHGRESSNQQSLMMVKCRTALHAAGALVMVVAMAVATSAVAESRIDTELRSLRALPPGFTAKCESGNLIFRSATSARFRIGKAALCTGKPDGYIVCSADGETRPDTSGRRPLHCSVVAAPGA